MRPTTIKITPITIKGERYWRLVWPNFQGGRHRKAFKLKSAAEKEMAKKKAEVASYGAASASIPDKLRVEAVECVVKLKAHGATLRDATAHYLKYLEAQQGAVELTKAVETFLAETKADGVSDRYLASLRHRLNKFTGAMEGRTTAAVTEDMLAEFLRGHTAVETKRSFRANLSTFFKWCVRKRYCASNPAKELKRIKSKDRKPGILTPQEIKTLLEECPDSIRAGVALAAFAGLRAAEVGRIEWSAIDLEERVIAVEGAVAKTAGRRTIGISDNLADWLAPLAKTEGKVWPEGDRYRAPWNTARLKSGWGPFFSTCQKVNAVQDKLDTKKLKPWPDNSLRHSFISYRLAETEDLSKTSLEAGNSPVMVKRHYLHLVKPSAAKAWFAVRPGEVESGKVTTLKNPKAGKPKSAKKTKAPKKAKARPAAKAA